MGNPSIHTSPDRQFIRISNKTGDQGVAERVLDDRPVAQMSVTCSSHQQEMLQVPDCLWSKHKTDVGLVKSTQPIKITVRPGAKLPYQRQYPLTAQALADIKPTIEGLLKAGVLVKTKSPCNYPIFQ